MIGPILRLITLPLTVVTLGLFSIVINYILFALTVWITPGLHTTGEISPWLANLYGAVIMMIVSTIMHQTSRSESDRGLAGRGHARNRGLPRDAVLCVASPFGGGAAHVTIVGLK